ncbi:glutamine-hydrolyzing carbamoyl-phosphate synthase small subunit [Granulicella mallensis]|jgi:carbamoyl-phosphate synthase small subunit|uniref:Carbamoyl phosphate synthase small chain n=1 Tax=Granulicella mallensis TaxID=940614 RepID=A0A7W7ZT64_9BACT|nr:glutamine-hydrolyzing carbamoyl-phosphate synthase small subunit [Granulicella mallensis]MBB5065700.1 carbamoyl-phosphate synthase small subunit [Granulicella mallensis]
MQAILALEDGRLFRGKAFGSQVERVGEVVFNTSLTGYQEIFTDPSYAGQIVILTNPHIGNYGTSPSDAEASRPYIEGLVVREFSPVSSNWRSTEVADEYLERNGVPVIAEIDTRAVVRHLRANGVMRGVISTAVEDTDALVAKARAHKKMDGTDLASVVSTKSSYTWDSTEPRNETGDFLLPSDSGAVGQMHVVAYDFGIKQNILRMLSRENCRVTVVPAKTSAAEVLALEPDGIFFSNGPGDPEPLEYAQQNIRDLQGKKPLFGICLGHQLFGLALGGKTYKLKFGHHGGNHPIKNLETGKVEITAQNHNFNVDPKSLPDDVAVTHINLNDDTLAGLKHKTDPMFSVQYHPEASPGPHDSHYLFRDFRKMMEEWKK